MDLNIPNSEILKTFNEKRDEFKPYGLTCELWTPGLMRKPDRHNEIEINYFSEGSVTYLLQDKKITIPAKKLAIFWGLVPHQIINFEGISPYFVCTIPLSQFLEWKLPETFVDRILKGEVLFETSDIFSTFDEFLLNNWFTDLNENNSTDAAILEMRARLSRMAENSLSKSEKIHSPIQSNEVSNVERIAVYIAQNFYNPIKVSEIGEAVGLHPDYANSIFKKAFGCTLNEYIIEERISHAKRNLVATDKSITEISFECGFNSISRFNAAFRKINNCTPREFRKRYH
jgi:AraC family transcriptional regulator, melibiose operon regulatory protein